MLTATWRRVRRCCALLKLGDDLCGANGCICCGVILGAVLQVHRHPGGLPYQICGHRPISVLRRIGGVGRHGVSRESLMCLKPSKSRNSTAKLVVIATASEIAWVAGPPMHHAVGQIGELRHVGPMRHFLHNRPRPCSVRKRSLPGDLTHPGHGSERRNFDCTFMCPPAEPGYSSPSVPRSCFC